jgi:imidazolonepropionase
MATGANGPATDRADNGHAGKFDAAIVNARLVTCAAGAAGLDPVPDSFVAWRDGRIAAVGPARQFDRAGAREVLDAGGRLLTPGLIDCHTHLVYAGDRAREFEQRLTGVTYEEIARSGGGIVSTVRATRAASDDELLAASLPRARALRGQGVTTLEIKSGYGLELAAETKQLRVARRVGVELGIDVATTCLAAHALPPEFAGRADDYIAHVCATILPAVAEAKLADAVDAFCERIGFTLAQTEAVLARAAHLGLPVKLHAEQLSDMGGTLLAARYGALSCDHLEYLSEAGVAALAQSGGVAVLLPGAFYFLRETKLPPVDALRRHTVPIAVSTDCNPGSSPTASLLLMLNMACTLFRLTPAEAFLGVTRHAARALGLQATHGSIEPGKLADLAVWDVPSVVSLAYEIGAPGPRAVLKRGRVVHGALA